MQIVQQGMIRTCKEEVAAGIEEKKTQNIWSNKRQMKKQFVSVENGERRELRMIEGIMVLSSTLRIQPLKCR